MENCGRVTRLIKKRAAVATPEPDRVSKKRVVLGEMTNLSCARPDPIKPRRGRQVAVKKETKAVVAEGGDEVEVEDPQMCGAYVSDIYDYLHKMEDPRFRKLVDQISKNLEFCEMAEEIMDPKFISLPEPMINGVMQIEPKRRPRPDYLEKIQKDITANMRGVLVD